MAHFGVDKIYKYIYLKYACTYAENPIEEVDWSWLHLALRLVFVSWKLGRELNQRSYWSVNSCSLDRTKNIKI